MGSPSILTNTRISLPRTGTPPKPFVIDGPPSSINPDQSLPPHSPTTYGNSGRYPQSSLLSPHICSPTRASYDGTHSWRGILFSNIASLIPNNIDGEYPYWSISHHPPILNTIYPHPILLPPGTTIL